MNQGKQGGRKGEFEEGSEGSDNWGTRGQTIEQREKGD